MPLVDLPFDIQTAIFEEVWNDSPIAACNLAATCRVLNQAGVPFLHRYLVINIGTAEELARDIKLLETTSIGQRYLRFTRYLKLVGGLLLPGERREHGYSKNHVERFLQPGTCFPLEETFRRDSHDWPLDYKFVSINNGLSYSWALSWGPFITTLQSGFSHLEDVIWEAEGVGTLSFPRIPPLLVPTLTQSHPHCRLHLRRFCFLSLHAPLTEPAELETVCSPCLHSLSILWLDTDVDHSDDSIHLDSSDYERLEEMNREAAIRILTVAPQLKHFAQIGLCVAGDLEEIPISGKVEREKSGFRPDPGRCQKASLRSLTSFNNSGIISSTELAAWQTAIDFSGLKRLSLRIYDSEILQLLTTGIEPDFPSLEELSVRFFVSHDNDEFLELIKSFLRALPPLAILRIYNPISDSIMWTIFGSHGESLKEFEFEGCGLDLAPYYSRWHPELEVEELVVIGEQCPNLNVLVFNYQPQDGRHREHTTKQLWVRDGGKNPFTIIMQAEIEPDGY